MIRGMPVVNIVKSNSSDEPIYLQIVKGELDESQLLPSIRNLAKGLKISVITYDELEKDGYIVTVDSVMFNQIQAPKGGHCLMKEPMFDDETIM